MGSISSESIQGNINYDICENQGNIFEKAAIEGYDMEQFSNYYMKSDFCNNHFDKRWSIYHLADTEECFEELCSENRFRSIVTKRSGGKICDPDTSWWIGFTYRQLNIETEVASSILSDEIPFNELCACYPGLHTVDEEYATDLICNKHNLIKVEEREAV